MSTNLDMEDKCFFHINPFSHISTARDDMSSIFLRMPRNNYCKNLLSPSPVPSLPPFHFIPYASFGKPNPINTNSGTSVHPSKTILALPSSTLPVECLN
mmetsp:Transcript_15699/g.33010  ORF Transcript_15699/g.33010 Transcript_15699/m.33010 type:complete len:99 (+) Transcript_15699:158-454(+)